MPRQRPLHGREQQRHEPLLAGVQHRSELELVRVSQVLHVGKHQCKVVPLNHDKSAGDRTSQEVAGELPGAKVNLTIYGKSTWTQTCTHEAASMQIRDA